MLSTTSLKLLWEDLQRRFGTQYILTRRINQDVLENFFGVIRSKGGLHDHPNALEFKYRLRSYIMGKNAGAYSEFSNVDTDDTPDLPVSGHLLSKLDSESETLASCNMQEKDSELQEVAYDGLENLAGFICYKLNDRSCESEDNCTYTWVDHLSEGALHKPSATFVSQLEELENIFQSINGSSLLIKKNYLKDLLDKSSTVGCSIAAKKIFFKSRMYFRIRQLNSSIPLKLGKMKNDQSCYLIL